MAVLFMAFLNGGAAFITRLAVESGQRVETEEQGKIVVSRSFLEAASVAERDAKEFSTSPDQLIPQSAYSSEAESIADRYGGSQADIEKKLHTTIQEHGTPYLVARNRVLDGFGGFANPRSLPAMLGSLILIWWAMMLVFQGEGLELDLQRRRHPM